MENVSKPVCVFLFLSGILMIIFGIIKPDFLFEHEQELSYQMKSITAKIMLLMGCFAVVIPLMPALNYCFKKIKSFFDSLPFETSENY